MNVCFIFEYKTLAIKQLPKDINICKEKEKSPPHFNIIYLFIAHLVSHQY